MADDAQRGVTFTLKANVDPSAKTEIDKLTSELTKAQTDLASASASASQQASAAAASAAASAEAQAKATIDKLKKELEDLHQTIITQTASISQQSSAASQAGQNEAAASSQSVAQKINETSQQVVQEQEKSAKEIMDSWLQSYDQSAEAAKKSGNDSVEAVNKTSESIADRLKQLEGEKAEIRKVSADKERADYIHAQLALVDITRRRRESEDALIEARDRGDSKSKIAALNDYAIRLQIEEQQVTKEIAEAKIRFIEAEKKEKAFLVDQEIKDLKRLQSEHERTEAAAVARNQKLSMAAGRVVSAFSEGSEALMRFVNGFQHLGLVGEKNLQKVQDAILGIQGTTQVFTGLIRMVRQISEGMDAYRKVSDLASASTKAVAAAQAVSTATTAAQTAATIASTAATEANTVAESANAIAKTAAGGAAAGSLMSRAASAAVSGGEAMIGASAAITGGALVAGGSALTVFVAGVVAAAGALATFVSLVLSIREAITFGIGGGASKDSFIQRVGTSSWNPFARAMASGSFTEGAGVLAATAGNIATLGMGGFGGKTSTEKAQEERDKKEKAAQEFRQRSLELQREAEREIKEITSERQSIVAKQHAAEKEIQQTRFQSMKPEERRAELIREIHRAEHEQSSSAEDRAKKVISLQKERLAVEKEINREQTQAAKEQLRNLEDQAKVKEREVEKARTEAMSAAERFGLLDKDEQRLLIESRRRFQAGAGGIDVDELKKLRGFSNALDEQINAEARRRAAAAGFGEFQGTDLRRLQQLENERQQIEVKVKAQADVVAKLEVDIDATARAINKQISIQWQAALNSMATQIAELQEKQTGVENRIAKRFGRVPQ